MKLIQKSNFRVQGMFFSSYCIEKNQNKTRFEEGSCSHTSLRDGSKYQEGWIFGKVPNGRWPPPPAPQNGPYLWKSCACISYLVPSSENSSDLAQPSFPYQRNFFIRSNHKFLHKSCLMHCGGIFKPCCSYSETTRQNMQNTHIKHRKNCECCPRHYLCTSVY